MAKKQLSDAEIKAQILARTQQENTTVESQFPTEIVPLPSKGLCYPTDNPLSVGHIEMKYMTAREEDILTNNNLLKQGKALDRLYEALVIGNGEGQAVKISDMIVGDRSAMMLAARVLGYGQEYEINITHPDTDKPFAHTVNLNDLKPRDFDESIFHNENRFEIKLPVSKKTVTFKLQTAKEQFTINKEVERQEKVGISKPITTLLKNVIIDIDGNDDKKYIHKFIDNQLLARDSLFLRNYMIDISPDYDLTVRVDRPDVGYSEDVHLPIGVDFFWPRS